MNENEETQHLYNAIFDSRYNIWRRGDLDSLSFEYKEN